VKKRPHCDARVSLMDDAEGVSSRAPPLPPPPPPPPPPPLDSNEQHAPTADELASDVSVEEAHTRAAALEASGRSKQAAQCYLYCVEKLFQREDRTRSSAVGSEHDPSATAALLARCLQRLAGICETLGKFEDALRFREAERMVYENTLLVLAESRGWVPPLSLSPSSSSSSQASFFVDPEADAEERRARNLEALAEIFFQEKNLEMAKAYAAKAIDIRRRLKSRGETTALAEQGRDEYQRTLRRYLARRASSELRGSRHQVDRDSNAEEKLVSEGGAQPVADEEDQESSLEAHRGNDLRRRARSPPTAKAIDEPQVHERIGLRYSWRSILLVVLVLAACLAIAWKLPQIARALRGGARIV
jgi:tetratricopeptide (TPR) repeat protein